MSFHEIKNILSEILGLEPESLGDKSIEHSIQLLMNNTDTRDINEYVNILKINRSEQEKLIEEIIVPETWFFRDKEPFVFLKQHVKNIWLNELHGKTIRVLSAPCSTGEEPYSIAMTLIDAGIPSDKIHIDAVDISLKSLEIAKKGEYVASSFRDNYESFIAQYFTPVNNGYKITSNVGKTVDFIHNNIVSSNFLLNFEPYHIIFCKNLIIYLNTEARKKVLENIERLLKSNGVLFTGHTEMTFFHQNGYIPVAHPRSFACTKKSETLHNVRISNFQEISIDYFLQKFKTITPYKKTVQITKAIIENESQDSSLNFKSKKSEFLLETIRYLSDSGSLEDAAKLCGEYIKEFNSNPEAYFLMGLINEATKNHAKSEEFYNKALYLNPNFYEALVHLSLLCEQKGDTNKAEILRDRAGRIVKSL